MPRRQQLRSSRSTTAPPDLLTVAETAAVLRCGLTFVYESIHRHLATGDPDEVPGRKVGRSLRVPRVGLERYIGAAITWPIVDHPIDEDAARFYSRFGFIGSPLRDDQLLLLLKDARAQIR